MRYGWSLEIGDWQALRNAIQHLEWRRAYLEHDYAARVPQRSGVYMICASTKNLPDGHKIMERFYTAIYVGQTINLRQRFNQHIPGAKKVVSARRVFRRLDFWFSNLEVSRLTDVEQLLISTFGPPANEINAKAIPARVGGPLPAGRIMGDRK